MRTVKCWSSMRSLYFCCCQVMHNLVAGMQVTMGWGNTAAGAGLHQFQKLQLSHFLAFLPLWLCQDYHPWRLSPKLILTVELHLDCMKNGFWKCLGFIVQEHDILGQPREHKSQGTRWLLLERSSVDHQSPQLKPFLPQLRKSCLCCTCFLLHCCSLKSSDRVSNPRTFQK